MKGSAYRGKESQTQKEGSKQVAEQEGQLWQAGLLASLVGKVYWMLLKPVLLQDGGGAGGGYEIPH